MVVFFSAYILPDAPPASRIGIYLKGAFLNDQQHNMTSNYVSVNLQLLYINSNTSNVTFVPEHDVKYVEVGVALNTEQRAVQ